MNIHITKEEHEFLLQYEADRVIVGSHMYGTNTEKSDTDILVLYNWPDEWETTGYHLPNIHQLQYKDVENNIDYIWTTKEQFIRNQRSGDSTINSDVILFTDKVVKNDEEKLKVCRTYKVIKAYLGFAKRDLKTPTGKKLQHAARSLEVASHLLDNTLPPIEVCDQETNISYYVSKKDLTKYESNLRKKANAMYDSGELQLYYIPKVEDKLYQKLLDSNNTKEFKYV